MQLVQSKLKNIYYISTVFLLYNLKIIKMTSCNFSHIEDEGPATLLVRR